MGKQAVFAFISIFFTIVIIHLVYSLENWPFSSFGMYKSLRTDSEVISLELYQLENKNKIDVFFLLGDYRFYLANQIERTIKNHYKNIEQNNNKALKSKLNEILSPIIVSKRGSSKPLFLNYKVWKKFSLKTYLKPDKDILINIGDI